MNVREEHPTDVEAVREVHQQAFGGDHGRLVVDLVGDLRAMVAAGDGLSLVAEHDGQVVGHVMFSRGARCSASARGRASA
jgi:putative acetyltransferase